MQPLLIYGLSFMCGMNFSAVSLAPLAATLYLAGVKRFLPGLLIALAGYIHYQSALSPRPEGATRGVGRLRVHEIQTVSRYYKTRYICKGTLTSFENYKNLFVVLSLPEKGPPMDREWLVEGTLNGFRFTPKKEALWQAVAGTYSLAELRYQSKTLVNNWVKHKIKDKNAARLLGGLITGNLDDSRMKKDFSELGLSHLLAISGFHFSLVALILSYLIKPFTNHKTSLKLLIALLAIYCLFLGGSPSVLRAFLTLLIFLLAPLLKSRSNSLNNLGGALLILLAFDPLSLHNIGFQLSFLATFSILAGFPAVKNRFPVKDVKNLSRFNKGVHSVFSNLKTAFQLNLSVTLLLLPALLAIFHLFPLASLFYNLFFPFMISLSIILLILSIFCPWLHPLNSAYTSFVLDLAKNVPPYLSYTFNSQLITGNTAIILTTLLFFALLNYRQVDTPSKIC